MLRKKPSIGTKRRKSFVPRPDFLFHTEWDPRARAIRYRQRTLWRNETHRTHQRRIHESIADSTEIAIIQFPAEPLYVPELRKDPITGRWVIIATDRAKRPSDFTRQSVEIQGGRFCPYCPGNELRTPPEILAYRTRGGANEAGWTLRVIPANSLSCVSKARRIVRPKVCTTR